MKYRRHHARGVRLSARHATGERAGYATGQPAIADGDFSGHPGAGPVPSPAQPWDLDRDPQVLPTRCPPRSRRRPGA